MAAVLHISLIIQLDCEPHTTKVACFQSFRDQTIHPMIRYPTQKTTSDDIIIRISTTNAFRSSDGCVVHITLLRHAYQKLDLAATTCDMYKKFYARLLELLPEDETAALQQRVLIVLG